MLKRLGKQVRVDQPKYQANWKKRPFFKRLGIIERCKFEAHIGQHIENNGGIEKDVSHSLEFAGQDIKNMLRSYGRVTHWTRFQNFK